MRKILISSLLSAVFLIQLASPATAFAGPSSPSKIQNHETAVKNVKVDADEELKDYKGEASGLFGNIRIPAALFAGASAGAAFAMPVSHTGEGLKLGLVKRIYALLMMSSLSSQVIAIVVATLTVGRLSTRVPELTTSVSELLSKHYDLEWVSARLHFLSGVIMFIFGIGLRAWVTTSCPIIAKAAFGIIVSTVFVCLAFIEETEATEIVGDGLIMLPISYVKLLAQRARRSPFFAVAFATTTLSWSYVIYNTPHIVRYLSR